MKRVRPGWYGCFFVVMMLFMGILFFPAEKAQAKTTYITMTEGETRYLYPNQDDSDYKSRAVVDGGGWRNCAPQYYEILSSAATRNYCQIKALKATSSPVILRLDYYYRRLVGNSILQGTGYVDYQITILPDSSSSSGGGSSSGHTHDWVQVEVTCAQTCTEDGQATQKCRNCSAVRAVILKRKGHSLKKTEAKAATVSEAGNIEYWRCSTCGKYFKDASAKEEIAAADIVLAKLAAPETPSETADGKENERGQTGQAEKIYTVKKMQYKITGTEENRTVAVTGCTKSKKSLTALTIGNTVTINGKKYKITAVTDGALKGYGSLKSVTIGNNVKTIGKESFSGCKNLRKVTLGTGVQKISDKAFYNCRKLKTITVKSQKLKSVGTSAVKNIHKKAAVRVPDSKKNSYKKLFRAKTGFKKPMRVKKI